MQLIGVTGGLASGKSTFCEACLNLGIPVIDADAFSRQALEPGTKTYKRVVALFSPLLGPSLFQQGDRGDEPFIDRQAFNDPFIDRQVLGSFIFKDEKYKKALEDIIHPYVRREMIRQIIGYFLLGYVRIMMEVPLLFETGLDKWCSKTILIYW